MGGVRGGEGGNLLGGGGGETDDDRLETDKGGDEIPLEIDMESDDRSKRLA